MYVNKVEKKICILTANAEQLSEDTKLIMSAKQTTIQNYQTEKTHALYVLYLSLYLMTSTSTVVYVLL